MSATKHTPGPWAVFSYEDQGPDRYPGIDAGDPENGGQTIVMWGDANDEDCGVRGETPEIALANAKLIAAAPELAEALERALEEGDHPRDCPFRHDEADCECWRSVVRAALRAAGRLP